MVTAKLRAHEARRIHDPNYPSAVEHLFTVNVLEVPPLPLGANPRAQNTNRQTYKDVRESLLNEDGADNAFLGKNLGIYACAEAVDKVTDTEYVIKFGEADSVLEGLDGVLNGGHTAKIIWDNQDKLREMIDDGAEIAQFVRLYVRVGYPRPVLAEMAGTLNTTMQVQEYSLAEHQDKFQWIHEALNNKPYESQIAFKENVTAPFYVTDLLSMLDLFNVVAYPNNGGKHPTGAYREKSQILKRYLGDPEPFKRLAPILNDILVLHDLIAKEGVERYNQYYRNEPNRSRGRGGALEWVDKRERRPFAFPFTGDESQYRLNRAAIYPALAAFRWMVDEDGAKARWKGGFTAVQQIWDKAGPEMMKMTQDTSVENGRKTLAIGKSQTHYNALHSVIAKHQLMSRT